MENAKAVITEAMNNCTQKSSSKKDEVNVMKAIINDPDYSVTVYDKSGSTEEYFPGRELRKVVGNTISAITKISTKEANDLVNTYEFSKSDAAALVGLSKEFINTYLQTGRKLPLGGREHSDIELMWKEVEERTAHIPTSDGKREDIIVPKHGGIRAINRCPSWIK